MSYFGVYGIKDNIPIQIGHSFFYISTNFATKKMDSSPIKLGQNRPKQALSQSL
jgi:hypothetical protein